MQKTDDILTADFEIEYEKNNAVAEDLIFMGGRKTVSLDGVWNYAIDQYNTCLRQKWFNECYFDEEGRALPVDYSFDEWPQITLPCSANLFQPELFWYEGPLVFTRKFNWDLNQTPDRKVFLRIGAANYTCRVFLNGKYICQHRGGSTPFMCEVTDYLKEQNRIIIVSDNTRNRNFVPTENTDWFNYGGVYREIELVTLPSEYIKDFKINLVPGSDYKLIRIAAKTSADSGIVKVDIPKLNLKANIEITGGNGEIILSAAPLLWSPASPVLYDVSASYFDDMISDRVGFREISTKGRDIILNGQKIFLRGISVHEESECNGKALSQNERVEIINIAKKLGVNYLRLAHYPHHEEMAKLCDEAGILLWEEIPVYWAIAFGNRATYESARNQLKELMKRDYNRASVIIWSVGNENPDSDERFQFMSGLVDFAHKYDKTRMVSAACLVDGVTKSIKDRLAEKLDIIGVNEYIGWYSPNFEELSELLYNSNPKKPVIITEFGADATAGLHGNIDEKGTEECQAEIYRKQIEVLRTIPYVKGMTPWILYDFRCPRRTSAKQKYYNTKGLLSADKRHEKLAFNVLRDFYNSVKNI